MRLQARVGLAVSVAVSAGVMCVSVAAAAAGPLWRPIERVNVASDGSAFNASVSDLSSDGNLVALVSTTGGHSAVYVRDRAAGVTTLVSHNPVGGPGDGDSVGGKFSRDGQFLVFSSVADDLVTSDQNGASDVFIAELATGRIELVSGGLGGQSANGGSGDVSVGSDGRFVAFASTASNLVDGDRNGFSDIFLRDRVSAVTTRVSGGTAPILVPNHDVEQDPAGTFFSHGQGIFSWSTEDSYDGGHSLKISSAQAPGQLARWLTRTDLVRVTAGARYRAAAQLATVGSLDAGYATLAVTFWSATHAYLGVAVESSQQVTGHQPNFGLVTLEAQAPIGAVFMRLEVRLYGPGSIRADAIEASDTSVAAEANGGSYQPALSGDGQVVAFTSQASNLVPGDIAFAEDVFVYERANGTTMRANEGSRQPNFAVFAQSPRLSADGRFVSYTTGLTSQGAGNVLIYNRLTGERDSPDFVALNLDLPWQFAFNGAMSVDGRYIEFALFQSTTFARFVYDRTLGTVEAIAAVDPFSLMAFSSNGQLLLISSSSPLTTDDTNTSSDAYLLERVASEPRFANTSLPEIHRIGDQLEAQPGVWTGAPTHFRYDWYRCDNAGLTCTGPFPPVSGNQKIYPLSEADLGYSYRVAEMPNNDAQTARPVRSLSYLIASTQPNLNPNGNLEADPAKGSYYTNGTGTFTWATDAAHSPTHALKVASNQSSGSIARWMTRIAAVPVTSGKAFDVSVWLKTQSVSHGNAQLVVTYWTATQAYVAGSATASAQLLTGNQDWTQAALLTIAPAGAAFMRVEFRLAGPGTLWADDVSVTAR